MITDNTAVGPRAAPLHCAFGRSILGAYERSQPEVSGRTRIEAAGKAARRSPFNGPPEQGGKSRLAPAAGNVDLRTREPPAKERTGAGAGRSDDRSIEVDGAGMSDNQARVSVRILEKEYHITCPIEERSDLLDSAEFLNLKMREIRDSGKVVGLDRIAVIAALNMANELIRFRNRAGNLESDVGGGSRVSRHTG